MGDLTRDIVATRRSPAASPVSDLPHRARAWVVRNRPAILLVALSILIPELLTGSTPVLGLLNPIGVAFLIGLYGGGVLTIREVTVRWGGGWMPVLLLGGAYGVAEEALGTKTFFDPMLVHNSFPAPWGHFWGVNWAWAVQLGVFHAVYSIGLPILLVGLAYPESRGRPLLNRRQLEFTFAIFLITVALMFALFDRGYALAPGLIAGSLVIILVLSLVARRWPRRWGLPRTDRPRATATSFLIVGGLFVWTFFGVNWLLASLTEDTWLVVAAQFVLTGATLAWILRNIGASANDAEATRLAVGLLSFLLVLASVLELVGDWGAVVPVLLLGYFLARLAKRYPVALTAPDGARGALPHS